MTGRPRRIPPDRVGRLLALGLIAALLGAIWAHNNSRLAAHLSARRPVIGLLSVRAAGQKSIVPPAFYLVIYGPTASLDIVSIPPSSSLIDHKKASLPRTLADAYGKEFAQAQNIADATNAMGTAALSLISHSENSAWLIRQSPSWRQPLPARSQMVSGHRLLSPLFWMDFELPPPLRPGFPGDIKQWLSKTRDNPLFWIRFFTAFRSILKAERLDAAPYDLFVAARKIQEFDTDAIRLSRLPAPEVIPRFFTWLKHRVYGRPAPDRTATVEVLNASEVPGVALKATKILRLQGFDVVHFGNARPPLQQALRVVDRAGRYEAAAAVLDVLGCRDTDVLTEMETKPSAEITIVLGRHHMQCTELGAGR